VKETFAIFLALLFSLVLVVSLNSQTVKAGVSQVGWTKTYGGKGSDGAYASVQTGDGGYALGCYTESLWRRYR
jgi:hypothetical protein